MSKIDDLIAKHCPDGVEHVALSKVAGYSRTRVDAADLDGTTFTGVDNLVAEKGGRVDATYAPNTARITAYEPGDVLLGNIRPYLKKVWLATHHGGCSGDVLAIRILPEHRERLEPEFLYYLLSSDSFFAYNMQHAKGAKMPRGNKQAIIDFRIPVPPLEVQREIVRVLDQFTQLEAELEAELEARRQQYAYYRDQLLAESKRYASIQPLGALADVNWGDTNTTKSAYVSDGERYLAFSAAGPDGYLDHYDYDRSAVVLSAIGALAGKTWRASGKWSCIKNTIRFFSRDESVVTTEYLYWVTSVPGFWPRRGSAQPFIAKGDADKIEIPVPPLEEQKRITDILDKFDALVNDLSSGLPAEIAARRQQYEHYRDRLLTFKEAA